MTNNIIVMIGFSIKYYHQHNTKINTTNKIILNVSYILLLIIDMIDEVDCTFIITIIILISLEVMIIRTYQIIILL